MYIVSMYANSCIICIKACYRRIFNNELFMESHVIKNIVEDNNDLFSDGIPMWIEAVLPELGFYVTLIIKEY